MLHGSKVTLKPATLKNASTFVQWFKDPEVIKYTTILPLSLKDEIEWLRKVKRNKDEEIWSIFVDGKLIGNTGAHDLKNKDRHFTVGLVIGNKNYWGKGYGTDAFQTLIKYLLKNKKAKKLILDVRTKNKSAIKVYKKCGFKIIKKIKKLWEREGKEYDCFLMELTNS
jgi:RimJ/RimL family protein N-acetyltransferase